MKQGVSIRDVAARAGVSVGTVSNTLNRPEAVADNTRKAVLAAIDELEFVRNGSASRLRAKKSTVIGLLVVDLANPFTADFVAGAEQALQVSGYSAIISDTGYDLERLEGRLRLMEEYSVAGVILPPMAASEIAPRIEAMRARGLAFVFVGAADPATPGCSVVSDQTKGGELAGTHLIDIGRRRIVYVGGPRDMAYSTLRLNGLRKAVAAHRHTDVEVVRIDSLTGVAGYAATEQIIAHEPDAIFCANDLTALGVLRGLFERGIRIPDDVALVGYDDIAFAEIAAVPLTTVRQPAHAIGVAAAELLVDEANDPGHVHRQVSFAPELVVRGTSVSTQGRVPRDSG